MTSPTKALPIMTTNNDKQEKVFRWVKASERFPENGEVFWRGENCGQEFYDGVFYGTNHNSNSYHQIEWLEELPSPVNQPGLSEAKELARKEYPIKNDDQLESYNHPNWAKRNAFIAGYQSAKREGEETLKLAAIDFHEWLIQNTVMVEESQIVLYRYNDRLDGVGNYILEDIYIVYLEQIKKDFDSVSDFLKSNSGTPK